MKTGIANKIKTAPKNPGVYIFYGNEGALYVGKAANLKNRLRSYLASSRAEGLKMHALHEESTRLDYIILRSEIEALIEESRLIKELKPKYNILWRDDKSYHYVYFTKEVYPKIFISHERSKRLSDVFARIGPFTDGGVLRVVMKLLRRYFPYCTCPRPHFRDCLNTQIGKCFGFCCKTSVLTRQYTAAQYRHNIKIIKMILRGQNRKFLKKLKDLKEREALEKIFEHRDYVRNDRSDRLDRDVHNSITDPRSSNISRIECYDISHFAGKEAVGAMTVLVKKDGAWVPDKNSYRKFKIKSAPTRDDPRMIYEIVSRRLNHPEWPYPDLIIIDGGVAQYKAALKALQKLKIVNCKLKIISYAKPQKQIIGLGNPLPEFQKLVEQAIYRTHNFVIRYHRQVRKKEFLG